MTNLTLQILGCGDAFASGGRYHTCFYVHDADVEFLIDCGASSLNAMKKHAVSTTEIDAIIITHFHGDHFGGVPFVLLDAAKIQQRQKGLTIFGPCGVEDKVSALMGLLYPGIGLGSLGFDIHFLEFRAGHPVSAHGLDVQAYEVIHSPESQPHAVKIRYKNKVLAFSGDTEWTDVLKEVADGADLFICECNFYGRKGKAHLDYNTLLAHKRELNCKRMVLNHLGEEMLENAPHLAMECAEDGKVYFI